MYLKVNFGLESCFMGVHFTFNEVTVGVNYEKADAGVSRRKKKCSESSGGDNGSELDVA